MGTQELADQIHRIEQLVRLHVGPMAWVTLELRPRHGVTPAGRPVEGMEITHVKIGRWPDLRPFVAGPPEQVIESITRAGQPWPQALRRGERSV